MLRTGKIHVTLQQHIIGLRGIVLIITADVADVGAVDRIKGILPRECFQTIRNGSVGAGNGGGRRVDRRVGAVDVVTLTVRTIARIAGHRDGHGAGIVIVDPNLKIRIGADRIGRFEFQIKAIRRKRS